MSFILTGVKILGSVLYTTVKLTLVALAVGGVVLYYTKPPLSDLKKQVEEDIKSNGAGMNPFQKVGVSIVAKLASNVPTYTNKDWIILNMATVKILGDGVMYIGILNQWKRLDGPTH